MRLGIVADLHLAPLPRRPARFHNAYDFAGALDRLRRALERFRAERVEGVAVLGDLSHSGDTGSLRRVVAECERLSQAPVWLVPGNHDCRRRLGAVHDAADSAGSPRLRVPGEDGERVARGVRVAGVVLGSCRGGWWSAARAPLRPDGWGSEPAVVLSHYPLLSRASALRAAGLRHAGDLRNRSDVVEPLLERAAATVVVCGHLHVREACADGTVLQLACAAAVEHPYELELLDVEGDGRRAVVTRRSVPLGGPDGSGVDPVLSPPVQRFTFSRSRWREDRGAAPARIGRRHANLAPP